MVCTKGCRGAEVAANIDAIEVFTCIRADRRRTGGVRGRMRLVHHVDCHDRTDTGEVPAHAGAAAKHRRRRRHWEHRRYCATRMRVDRVEPVALDLRRYADVGTG